MKINRINTRRLWYGAAILVLMLGCLTSAIITISTLSSYPSLISAAYKSPLRKVEVPGEVEIDLSRRGAYGVYLEAAHVPIEGPPALDCNLNSKTSGDDIPLVPDYVPTNRYETQDDRVGVLIYSTTVDDPGLYRLSCEYPDGRARSKLMLAIGPNYFFEFLRVAWKLGGSILGGAAVLIGSVVLSFLIALLTFIGTKSQRQVGGELDD